MREVEDWIQGGPWIDSTNRQIWPHVANFKETGLKPLPFHVFGRGWESFFCLALHEISHLILCRDQDALDPFFGSNEWVDNVGEFSWEAGWLELRVLALEQKIKVWCGFPGGDEDVWSNASINFVISKMTHKPAVSHTQWNLEEYFENLDIDQTFQELQRKYQLIREQQCTVT